jgi:hypothetical protein
MGAVTGELTHGQRSSNEPWALLDKELLRAHRVASDTLQREDIAWLCKGFSAFLSSGGKIPLERCLCLPTNERALRRARRDHWLRRAWLELDPTLSPWRRSELLATEIHRFQSAKWSRWSQFERSPTGIRPLDEALFEAFRCQERIPSTAMQLHNIAGHQKDH